MSEIKELINSPGYRKYLDKNGIICEARWSQNMWKYYFHLHDGQIIRHGLIVQPYDATCEQIENSPS